MARGAGDEGHRRSTGSSSRHKGEEGHRRSHTSGRHRSPGSSSKSPGSSSKRRSGRSQDGSAAFEVDSEAESVHETPKTRKSSLSRSQSKSSFARPPPQTDGSSSPSAMGMVRAPMQYLEAGMSSLAAAALGAPSQEPPAVNIAVRCRPLPSTAIHYRPLSTTIHHRPLPSITIHYRPLPSTIIQRSTIQHV